MENVVRKQWYQTWWKVETGYRACPFCFLHRKWWVLPHISLVAPCIQLVRVGFVINYQGGHFYWLRSFYSHKLSVHFGLTKFHKVLSTSHPFPHFPQCLPVLFLLSLVFSFLASSFWSSSPKSGISLLWNKATCAFTNSSFRQHLLGTYYIYQVSGRGRTPVHSKFLALKELKV